MIIEVSQVDCNLDLYRGLCETQAKVQRITKLILFIFIDICTNRESSEPPRLPVSLVLWSKLVNKSKYTALAALNEQFVANLMSSHEPYEQMPSSYLRLV